MITDLEEFRQGKNKEMACGRKALGPDALVFYHESGCCLACRQLSGI